MLVQAWEKSELHETICSNIRGRGIEGHETQAWVMDLVVVEVLLWLLLLASFQEWAS